MLGAVTYELTAVKDERMEGFAGRLLHAAFFRHLAACSPRLSHQMHDEENIKPFTVSPLIQPQGVHEMVIEKAPFSVTAGERFFWRVSALQSAVLEAALLLKEKEMLQVGRVPFVVTAVYADGTHESGCIEEEALISSVLEAPPVREISFHFRSPAAFRRGTSDYTLPIPELVFSSLADKWSQAGMPGSIEKSSIRELTLSVFPSDWRGKTKRVYFGRHHGATGCMGDFTYQLKDVTEQNRNTLLLLAQYANFSGVGRLTAQGFGQTRTTFR